jgi:hypothetical protein
MAEATVVTVVTVADIEAAAIMRRCLTAPRGMPRMAIVRQRPIVRDVPVMRRNPAL